MEIISHASQEGAGTALGTHGTKATLQTERLCPETFTR